MYHRGALSGLDGQNWDGPMGGLRYRAPYGAKSVNHIKENYSATFLTLIGKQW